MPCAQGVSGTVERTKSTDASVCTSVPRLLESVRVGEVRNGRGETAGVDSRLGIAGGGKRSVKLARTVVCCFLFELELPDFVSEVPKFLFDGFLADGATDRSGVRTGQRKRHGGRDDVWRGGGGRAGTGGEFGVWGGGHEGSGLFVNVGGIKLIITRVV